MVLLQRELSLWVKTLKECHSETAAGLATRLAVVSIVFLLWSSETYCGCE